MTSGSAERKFTPAEIAIDKEALSEIPVIGIAGPMGSGEETVSSILEKRFGFSQFRISDNLTAIAKGQGIQEPSRQDLRDISAALVEKHGPGINIELASQVIAICHSYEAIPGTIIDGIRHLGEAQALKALPKNLLIGVYTSEDIRWQRVRERVRKWGIETKDDFDSTNRMEIAQIAPIWPLCDKIFNNDGMPQDFERDIVRYLEMRLPTLVSSK